MIQFPDLVRIPVQNALDARRYWLIRTDTLTPEPNLLSAIAAICNEPAVYDWLFREGLQGQPYPPAKAGEWLAWAAAGWRENTHFCFALVDEQGAIAAACDIKSNDPDEAEVGYWASAAHRGVMTNTVVALCQAAREAGFRRLVARTRKANQRSQAVLLRAGFQPEPSREDAGDDWFVLGLGAGGGGG
jgi:RimJ/RimL family protein N-acetyltransferase